MGIGTRWSRSPYKRHRIVRPHKLESTFQMDLELFTMILFRKGFSFVRPKWFPFVHGNATAARYLLSGRVCVLNVFESSHLEELVLLSAKKIRWSSCDSSIITTFTKKERHGLQTKNCNYRRTQMWMMRVKLVFKVCMCSALTIGRLFPLYSHWFYSKNDA